MTTIARNYLPVLSRIQFSVDGEEEEVDAFTEALAINEETLDTHIASSVPTQARRG